MVWFLKSFEEIQLYIQENVLYNGESTLEEANYNAYTISNATLLKVIFDIMSNSSKVYNIHEQHLQSLKYSINLWYEKRILKKLEKAGKSHTNGLPSRT